MGAQGFLGSPYCGIDPVSELVGLGPMEVNFDHPWVGTIIGGDLAPVNSCIESLPDNTVISPEQNTRRKQA